MLEFRLSDCYNINHYNSPAMKSEVRKGITAAESAQLTATFINGITWSELLSSSTLSVICVSKY